MAYEWLTSMPVALINSWQNLSMSSAGIHDEPKRTSISVAVKSSGWTALSASTFSLKRGSVMLAASAISNFSRTFPERY